MQKVMKNKENIKYEENGKARVRSLLNEKMMQLVLVVATSITPIHKSILASFLEELAVLSFR